MNPDQTINWNAAECLQKTNHWGLTVIQNICSGKSFDVPWGSWDFLLAWCAAAAIIVTIVLFAAMTICMLRLMWD